MTIALSTLSSRLQGDVAARNSVPSSTQYEQCVRDAVADFSRRAPMQKVTTIAVVSGTASYALPADFMKIIRFALALNVQAGILNTASGIIPVAGTFKERVMVQGNALVIYPTPLYTMTRELWYMAGYVLDSSYSYPDLTDEAASIVMLKARAEAMGLQANDAAKESWSYTIGDESVTKTNLGPQMREQVKAVETQYLAAVSKYIGQGIARGEAPSTFTV